MNRIVQLAWIAFAAAGAICFSVIAHKVAQVPRIPDLQPVATRADGVLARLEAIESKANATLVNVDSGTKVWAASAKDQAESLRSLTKGVAGAVQDARLAIGDVRVAVQTAQKQEEGVGPLLDSLRTTSDAAQPVLGHLALTASASTRMIDTVNGRLSDQKVDELLTYFRDTAQHFDGITDSIDKMGKHIEKKVDSPPTKMERVEEWAPPIVKTVVWWLTK